jgi:hypothetical protein
MNLVKSNFVNDAFIYDNKNNVINNILIFK